MTEYRTTGIKFKSCTFTNKNISQDFIMCLHFATEAHKHQKRKDPDMTPYINHPIGVAYIASEEAGIPNLELLMGCLLHDTVEDTDIVLDDIRVGFGDYVSSLVQEVTDNKELPKEKRKEMQILHASTSSPLAKIVKLADKLYNLRDLERVLPIGWSEQRRTEYFRWAFEVCLGLRGVCSILEAKLEELFKRKGLTMPLLDANAAQKEIFNWTTHAELKMLMLAANFAAVKHRNHLIFDATNGLPYINHLVSMTCILSNEANIEDVTILSAALLCDVVGKANIPLEEISNTFGGGICNLVKELTYDHSRSVEDRFKEQIDHAAKMSHAARLITLACIVDNCRRLEKFDPDGWMPNFKQRYFQLMNQLSAMIAGTQPSLEAELDSFWAREYCLRKKM